MGQRQLLSSSPRFKARLAGIFEALEGLSSAFGQVVVLGKVIVLGSAAVTAANILAHERLLWVGFASSVAGVAFHAIWILLFYELFRPVNRSISLLAVFVGLVVCAVQALTAVLYIAPWVVLQEGVPRNGFTPEQMNGLALIFARLNAYAFNVDLAFFGLWCVLTGYLIFRSTFLPRILGVLLAIDGLGWMTYVAPPVAAHLFPAIAAASAVAEIPLQLWLISMGVNAERWKEQAISAGVRT